MRRIVLPVVLVFTLGVFGFAQTAVEPVEVAIFASELSAEIPPPPGGLDDGQIFRYSGKVTVVINGIKMHADTVDWWEKYDRLVFNGTVQVDLPGPPTSLRYTRMDPSSLKKVR